MYPHQLRSLDDVRRATHVALLPDDPTPDWLKYRIEYAEMLDDKKRARRRPGGRGIGQALRQALGRA